MIMSTGIATYEDIQLAVDTCRAVGNNDITVLKCTSSYPAPINEANMIMMQQFAKDFDVKVGLSDHTLGITLPVVATVMGASVIEKHFILDKSVGGPDAAFSLDEKAFTQMVNAVREAEQSIGTISYELTEKQQSGKQFSRSLYVSKDVKKGDIITKENVRSVRPGYGMHPKHLESILGKTFTKDVENGEPLNWEYIK
jgi:pseudaminic acid synthase